MSVSSSVKIGKAVNLDEWQQNVLNTSGNIVLCSGRQVGKSLIVAIKAAEFAVKNHNASVMIISASERQAEELFRKVMAYLDDNYKRMVKRGRERPTKNLLKLQNGTFIRCLPTGLDGRTIRTYTVDLLIADEAAFIFEEVWAAVTPMLLTTGGDLVLVSTPFGRRGYFYDCYNSEDFTTFHVNSEATIKERGYSSSWTEKQRERAIEHLEREKKRMTELQYAQEYLGQFVDELQQLFPDELIKQTCVLKRAAQIPRGRYYMGCDIARLGGDETTYEIVDLKGKDRIEQVENITKIKQLTTKTYEDIVELTKKYNMRYVGIDAGSGSLGVGILDFLLQNDATRRKTVALTNQKRLLDFKGERKKTLLKEDMYLNLVALMQSGRIRLLQDDNLMQSLRSVQYEHVQTPNKDTTTRIFGDYTHIAEGLIRAAWLASQEKQLNINVHSIKI